jgi:bisphosphoglycerate-independent phosphoglycerate mutase (AlkP superfamily)
MGNSDCGHLNIGSGQIPYQDIVRIDLMDAAKMAGNDAFKRSVGEGALAVVVVFVCLFVCSLRLWFTWLCGDCAVFFYF